MNFIGIDPGKSGSIAFLDWRGRTDFIKCTQTERDLSDFIVEKLSGCHDVTFAMIEQVSAMPKQGVSSTFKFGQSYGFLRGILIANGVPFETVTPSKWQGELKCRTKGDKNITKAKAQELFPQVKITHAIADALLLAEYCRRKNMVVRCETSDVI